MCARREIEKQKSQLMQVGAGSKRAKRNSATRYYVLYGCTQLGGMCYTCVMGAPMIKKILKSDHSDFVCRKSSRALTFENLGMLVMGAPMMIFCPSTSRCVVEHRLR